MKNPVGMLVRSTLSGLEDDYTEAVVKYFGYLGEPERAKIATEIRHDLW